MSKIDKKVQNYINRAWSMFDKEKTQKGEKVLSPTIIKIAKMLQREEHHKEDCEVQIAQEEHRNE